MIAEYGAEIQRDGGTEQKQMGRGRCAFVSRPELRDRRDKAVKKGLAVITVNEGFDQCNLQEGAVS